MEKEELKVSNKCTMVYNGYSRYNINSKEKLFVDQNDIDKQDEEHLYEDLVINASIVGNLDILGEYLNDHNVNDFLYTGWTLLLYATSYSNLEAIKYLLTNGADCNKHKDGFTPLMALCSSTRGTKETCLHCLKLLIEASANVEAINKAKQTALMYACKTKDVEFVKELLKYIKNINACDNEGQTALIYAVLANKFEIVQLLIENQANIEIKNRRSETAKDVANFKGYEKISLLLSSEDDVQVTYEVSKIEEWEDMFPNSNLNKDKVVDYDITNILYGMGLENYTYLFQGIKLYQFLQLTDEDLINLGMDISVHRNKFQYYLNKFHCKPWSVETLGVINKLEPYTLYNGLKNMVNVAKQLSIMKSSFCFIKNNIDSDFKEKIFADDVEASNYKQTIKDTEKALKDLKKELFLLQALVDKIDVESSLPVPPCYIGPKDAKRLSCRPIMWSILLICGLYLLKIRVYK